MRGNGRPWWLSRRRLVRRFSPRRLFGKPASNLELRERVLTVFLVVALVSIFVFIPINLILDPTGILSLLDVAAGIAVTINLYYFLRFRKLRTAAFITLLIFSLLIVFAGIRAGPLYLFWSLIMPPMSYFLLGTRWGTVACLGYGVVLGGGMFLLPESSRDPSLLIHLPLSFLTFSSLGFFAERVRESYEARLAALSTTDSLTGILNRRHMEEIARSEIQKSRRYGRALSFLIFDIDYFKQVNDRLGHQAGDHVLTAVTKTVTQTLRDTDYFARWGGEEFLILAPETGAPELEILAERLKRITAENSVSRGTPITISLGGTTLAPGDGLTHALARADRALYLAKNSGRNAARFEHASSRNRKR